MIIKNTKDLYKHGHIYEAANNNLFIEKVDDVKYYILYTLKDIYQFILSFKRACEWFWYILRKGHRDYDYQEIYAVLNYKLTRMKNKFAYLKKKGYYTKNTDKKIKQLKVCTQLLKKLEEDEYTSKDLDRLFAKYPLIIGDIVISNLKRNEAIRKIHEKHKKLYTQDLYKLLEIIKDNIISWWV